MFGLGVQELIIIFLIVLLLFGGKKIPEVARGLGKGLREFRKARDEIERNLQEPPDDTPDAKATPTPDPGRESGSKPAE